MRTLGEPAVYGDACDLGSRSQAKERLLAVPEVIVYRPIQGFFESWPRWHVFGTDNSEFGTIAPGELIRVVSPPPGLFLVAGHAQSPIASTTNSQNQVLVCELEVASVWLTRPSRDGVALVRRPIDEAKRRVVIAPGRRAGIGSAAAAAAVSLLFGAAALATVFFGIRGGVIAKPRTLLLLVPLCLIIVVSCSGVAWVWARRLRSYYRLPVGWRGRR